VQQSELVEHDAYSWPQPVCCVWQSPLALQMRPLQHSSPKMQPLPTPPQVPATQRPSEQMFPGQHSECCEQVPLDGVHVEPFPQTPLMQVRGLAHSLVAAQRTPAGPGVG
jgi:hypothetical protein